MSPKRTEGAPHDDLTRLANDLIDQLPECIRAVVMLFDADNHGGIGLGGYDTDSEALAEIFVHLGAIFEANGKKLMVVPVREG